MGKNNISYSGFNTSHLIIVLSLLLAGCRFDEILQPSSAAPGAVIEIQLTISDDLVPEPNAHKGLLCILIPEDWSFESGTYSGTVGSGNLELSAEWADSAQACYPSVDFATGMKWIALISDQGYAYSEPISIDINVLLRVGQTEGCFSLAYLLTKATPDLLCTGYSPLSYPHPIGIPDSCSSGTELKVETAPEWDDLFDRTSGWTGADGIYTIPLDGLESPGSAYSGHTFMTFGDTFIGEVDQNGRRVNSILVNNTYAILYGNQPLNNAIDFYWDADGSVAKTVFIPNTPESKSGDWYWPMDGVVIGDSVYVFGLRLDKNVEPFNPIGVNLISFTVDPDSGINSEINQMDTPLFYEPEDKSWEIVLGQAVMDMRFASGNPNADGYIYVYGPRSESFNKKLLCSRFLPEDVRNFSAWEFWDGNSWGHDIAECADIIGFISQEFSVNPIDEDAYLAVFQTGDLVVVQKGYSPVGPFDAYRAIYNPPEDDEDTDIFIYNAKAHPHLSEPGKLLISYNVNTNDFGDLFNNADIYRPRFINLFLENLTSNIDSNLGIHPVSIDLYQNYPNPFNSSTRIKYRLNRTGNMELSIYTIHGQKVITLINGIKSQGTYEVIWDGKDKKGSPLSSGVYIYRLQSDSQVYNKKMILIN